MKFYPYMILENLRVMKKYDYMNYITLIMIVCFIIELKPLALVLIVMEKYMLKIKTAIVYI